MSQIILLPFVFVFILFAAYQLLQLKDALYVLALVLEIVHENTEHMIPISRNNPTNPEP